MQRISGVLILFLAALAFSSCGKKEQSSSAGTTTIAVIPKGTTHEFWKSIHAGANKAAKEAGVEIIWKGPLKEDNREDQVKVVEDFISRGVNGIVLAPLITGVLLDQTGTLASGMLLAGVVLGVAAVLVVLIPRHRE